MDQLLSLPTDILLHLLNSQFSLQELLHLRVLCHHFRCLIESANCIGRRRTLKLFWSFRDIKRYTLDLYQLGLDTVPELRLRDISSRHSDDLVLISAKFTESTCDLLVRLFHRVRHLVIYFTHNKRDLYTSKFSRNYADYLLLARHLFPKLTHLTGLSLFGKFNHSTCHADLHQHHTEARVVFCEAINRIGSLRRLDLCLENLFDIVHPLILNGRLYYVRKLVPASLEQILPHLERLSFCGRSEQFVERIIGHLGAHCSTLRLHRLYLPPTDQGQQMIKQLAQRSITLKHLQMTQQFYSISSRAQCFAQLESLELMLHHENDPHEPKETMCRLEVILPNLVKLNKLAKLTLMGFDITLFEQQQQHQLENSLPIMRQIGQLSINSAHYLLSNTRAWFRGLSHIFPTVHHLTLAFNMYYTIDLRTDVSRNFPNCTHFRLLYLLCDDLTHTLVSSLGRHHRKRFYRLYDRQPGMSVDLWCEEDQHEAEQLWTRTNGQNHKIEAFQLAHQSTFQALNCGVCEQWLDIPINVNNNDAHPVVDLWHNHHLVHQNSNWNRCTFDGCYQRFEDSVELMHHARTAHQNQMGNFHCVSPNCGILFSSYNEARVHHLEVHQNGWIRCLRPAHGLGGICGLMVEGTFFEFFNVRGITFFAPGEEEVLCDLHQAAFNIGNIQ